MLLLLTTYFIWIISGTGDSSFIPTSRDSFGMTCQFYEGGGEEAAIRPYQFSNFSPVPANRRFFPSFVPNKNCHSELIHQTRLKIQCVIWWINEESPVLITKPEIFIPKY